MKYFLLAFLLLGVTLFGMQKDMPQTSYISTTAVVRNDDKIVMNIECKTELSAPAKEIELVVRIYRPGRPVKIINLNLDV